MKRFSAGVVAAACLLWGSTAAPGALTQGQVEKIEGATALVVVTTEYGPAFGTAFCIDAKGLFATDAHVVLPIEGRLQLVIHPGEKDQKVVNAQVVGADSSMDLAVIQAENAGELTPLQLGDSDTLFPTQEVTAFGYPFGDMLTVEKSAYPSISVNSGKVTSLRKKDGALYLVQIDAAVNPGNSGGPIVDDTGKVMGLVEAAVRGSGVNFAIPVARLKGMLAKPLISVEPGAVRWSQRGAQQAFTVKVTTLKYSTTDYQVSLVIKQDEEDKTPRTFTGNTTKGQCVVTLAPVAKVAPVPKNTMPTPYVTYDVTLSRNGNTVATTEGPIAFTGAPESDAIFSFLGGQIPRGRGRGAPVVPATPKDPLPVDAQVIGPVGNTKSGTPFHLIEAAETIPFGLHIVTAKVAGKTIIRDITVQWDRTDTGNARNLITGRMGYVVGGLNVDASDTFLDAVQVIFIAQKADGTLNPKDTYTSEWVGFANAKPEIHTLGGKGERIIGFTGFKSAGNVVTAIGVVQELPPGQAPPQGVEEPLAPEKSVE